MPDLHLDLVAFIFGLLLYIAWQVRLESKTNQNEKDIGVLWAKHDAVVESHNKLERDMLTKLSEISSSLSEIKGYLSATNLKKE